MYKIEITTETAEALVKDILVEDYVNLCKWIDEDGTSPDLARASDEDMLSWIKYRNALKVLLEYYLPHEAYLELIGLDGG
jgi:hypothetical protein